MHSLKFSRSTLKIAKNGTNHQSHPLIDPKDLRFFLTVMFQMFDNSQLCIDSLFSIADYCLKFETSNLPTHLDRLKEGTWLNSFVRGQSRKLGGSWWHLLVVANHSAMCIKIKVLVLFLTKKLSLFWFWWSKVWILPLNVSFLRQKFDQQIFS